MDISFNCGNCGQYLVIDAAGGGLQVQCPKCQAELTVPDGQPDFPKGSTSLAAEAQPPSAPAPPNQATEKQRVFLRDLGATCDTTQLAKERASELIEDALSKRPPTQRQIEKLKRLGLLDDLEEDATAQDARELLDFALHDAPTEYQLARAEELGFTIPEDAEFTAGALDDILKLADRQPDEEMLTPLSASGISLCPSTALEARMLLELVEAYSTDDWEDKLPRTALADVCTLAVKDPAFYVVTLDNKTLGMLQQFRWPESKLQEWFNSAVNATAAWEEETRLRPGDACAFKKLGEQYTDAGRTSDAIAAYKQAINLAATWYMAWIALGGVYHRSGAHKEAEAAFKQAKGACPEGFAGFAKHVGPNTRKLYPGVID